MPVDPSNYMVSEAIDALALVFPSHTIKLMQVAVDLAVRERDFTAGDQLAMLEFADLLRHIELRRPFLDQQRQAEGITAVWEQVPADPDPLKGVKPRLVVAPTDPPSRLPFSQSGP